MQLQDLGPFLVVANDGDLAVCCVSARSQHLFDAFAFHCKQLLDVLQLHLLVVT